MMIQKTSAKAILCAVEVDRVEQRAAEQYFLAMENFATSHHAVAMTLAGRLHLVGMVVAGAFEVPFQQEE